MQTTGRKIFCSGRNVLLEADSVVNLSSRFPSVHRSFVRQVKREKEENHMTESCVRKRRRVSHRRDGSATRSHERFGLRCALCIIVTICLAATDLFRRRSQLHLPSHATITRYTTNTYTTMFTRTTRLLGALSALFVVVSLIFVVSPCFFSSLTGGGG